MAKITGVGGVFFKSMGDSAALAAADTATAPACEST
jgi:hypothetical protein